MQWIVEKGKFDGREIISTTAGTKSEALYYFCCKVQSNISHGNAINLNNLAPDKRGFEDKGTYLHD